MSDDELRRRIGGILDDHEDYDRRLAKNLARWCGCYEGDLGDEYPIARREATDALVALFRELCPEEAST